MGLSGSVCLDASDADLIIQFRVALESSRIPAGAHSVIGASEIDLVIFKRYTEWLDDMTIKLFFCLRMKF